MKGTTGRRGNTLPTRIKRLMQKDAEIGRIAAATPTLISRAMELFLRKLCTHVAECAQERKAKTVSPSHLKHYIENDEMMDFLKLLVADIPVLTMEPSTSPSKRSCPFVRDKEKGRTREKRQRTKRQCSISPEIGRPVSVFASMSNGSSESWSACPTRLSTLQASRSDVQQMTITERPGRVISLPTMRSAARTNTEPVDPSSLPVDLQNALNIPKKSSSNRSPSMKKAPENCPESVAMEQEMDTPMSVYSIEFAKPIAEGLTQCAEEDNYEFSDDEA